MRSIIITAPTDRPVPISAFLRHDRINTEDDLDQAQDYLDSATDFIQDASNRQLCLATREAYCDYPLRFFNLPYAPLVSVVSVKYLDSNGTTQTLDPSNYRVDATSMPGRLHITNFPSFSSDCFPNPLITIRYTCGFSTPDLIPHKIRQAVKLLAANWYETRTSLVEKPLSEIPTGFQYLLDSFRVYSPTGGH